jgi:hypothetical protein
MFLCLLSRVSSVNHDRQNKNGAYLRSKFIGNAKEITQFFRSLSLGPVDDRLTSEIAGKLVSGSGAVPIITLRLTRVT